MISSLVKGNADPHRTCGHSKDTYRIRLCKTPFDFRSILEHCFKIIWHLSRDFGQISFYYHVFRVMYPVCEFSVVCENQKSLRVVVKSPDGINPLFYVPQKRRYRLFSVFHGLKGSKVKRGLVKNQISFPLSAYGFSVEKHSVGKLVHHGPESTDDLPVYSYPSRLYKVIRFSS